MMPAAHPNDPSDFLATPRRTAATPNPAGTHALFSLSTHSFQTHRTENTVHVLDLQSNKSALLSQDAQATNHTWTGFGSEVIWQKKSNTSTEFWIDDAAVPAQRQYRAGVIEGSPSILKIACLSNNAFAIVAHGPKPLVDGGETKFSTGNLFHSLPVRTFFPGPPVHQVLWYLRFDRDKSDPELRFGLSWSIIDILKDTGVEFVPYGVVLPMGPTNCDMSPFGFVFAGRTPGESNYHDRVWTSDLFFIPRPQLQSPDDQARIVPHKLEVEKYSGTVSLPIISASGSVAFLKNEDKAKVISKNHIFFLDLAQNSRPEEIMLNSNSGAQSSWPLNPDTLTWTNDEKKLLITAVDAGRQKAFEISVCTSSGSVNIPAPLDIGLGSVSSIYRYSSLASDCRVLISKTSLIDSSSFIVVDLLTSTSSVISTLPECVDFGLSRSQISEFWFKGHGDYQVHSWLIKPSYYQDGEEYPLALMIHGGPLDSWKDAWSTRWNPVLFAEQGYIVVCPDITGSLGYNEEFKEAAIHEMGGPPYHDLENCFQYAEEHIQCADTTNAVALGGSYGGYMIFWIAGQFFARKFKALVAHAGAFNVLSLYASDVPDIYKVLFSGYGSSSSQIVEKSKRWDPAQFAHKWQTPILITHGELDRRHPSTMGLAAFTMAQMNGVESAFLSFTDEGHFIAKPENSLQWHRAVIDWLNRYTAK